MKQKYIVNSYGIFKIFTQKQMKLYMLAIKNNNYEKADEIFHKAKTISGIYIDVTETTSEEAEEFLEEN